MTNQDDARIGRKISETVQAGSLYMTGALPMSGKLNLLRSTRTVVKCVWIGSMVVLPLTIVLIAVLMMRTASFAGIGLPVHNAAADPMLTVQLTLLIETFSSLLVIPVLRELLRIIDNTLAGDPFIPQNARSLRNIGWYLLAMTLVSAATMLTSGVVKLPRIGSLLTVLLVFVLAKVFEKGSAMRTELQETI